MEHYPDAMDQVIIQPQTTQDQYAAAGLFKALSEAGCGVQMKEPLHSTLERKHGGFEDEVMPIALTVSLTLDAVALLEKILPVVKGWGEAILSRYSDTTKVTTTIIGPDQKILEKVQVPEED
jgi:hypothetical protein